MESINFLAEKLWGPVPQLNQTNFPPLESAKITGFIWRQPYENPVFLHQKYIIEGLSISQITARIFSSTSTVHKYLRRFNIPLRQTDAKTKTRLRYGEAISKAQVVADRLEVKTIHKMKALREEGFSFWKIADILNAMNIPTKTRRGRWHARSVQKVLDDHSS